MHWFYNPTLQNPTYFVLLYVEVFISCSRNSFFLRHETYFKVTFCVGVFSGCIIKPNDLYWFYNSTLQSPTYFVLLDVEVFVFCLRNSFPIRAWYVACVCQVNAGLTSHWLAPQNKIPSTIAADARFGGHRAERVGEASHPGPAPTAAGDDTRRVRPRIDEDNLAGVATPNDLVAGADSHTQPASEQIKHRLLQVGN